MIDQVVSRFASTDPVSIIHGNYGGVSSWATVAVARKHGIPSVVTYQGSDVHTMLAGKKRGWRLCRDSFKFAKLNLLVSRSLEPILREYTEPVGRCEVLLRGVDQSKFYPAPKLADNRNVLFAGRVEEAKGAFDLLSAWIKVQKAVPGASLHIAGADRTGGLFLKTARTLGIQESITLHGAVAHSAIPQLMRDSQIFCLPSHKEGTPNSVTEALSCGLPVVATRVGGIPDVVEHGKQGLLVEEGDVGGLAQALIGLLNDRERCVRQGLAAQEFAREHLDAWKSVGRLIELYGELIRENNKKAA